jgi:hypothetical protein
VERQADKCQRGNCFSGEDDERKREEGHDDKAKQAGEEQLSRTRHVCSVAPVGGRSQTDFRSGRAGATYAVRFAPWVTRRHERCCSHLELWSQDQPESSVSLLD